MSFPTSLTFFFFSLSFQCGICGFTIATGGAARLVFGYDSYGNTCGQRNEPIEGVRLSGLDHTDRKWVSLPFLSLTLFFFLHSAPSQPLTFLPPHSLLLHTRFFSVVNGQRWNQSAPALALRLSHQCNVKRLAFHLEMAEDYLSYIHEPWIIQYRPWGRVLSQYVVLNGC